MIGFLLNYRYKFAEDGYRRLQTIRLESIEVNEMSDYEEKKNAVRIVLC